MTPLTDAETRKLTAHALLEARRELYVLRGRRALLVSILNNETASADDVRAGVSLPGDLDPKLFGVVPGALARLGIIEPAGFIKSTRPECHARHVQCWRLIDRAAAVSWLVHNPDRPDPGADRQRDHQACLFDVQGKQANPAVAPTGLASQKELSHGTKEAV